MNSNGCVMRWPMLSLSSGRLLIAEWSRLASRQGEECQEGGLSMSALVMVIDDSPTVRKILEVPLRREGMEVVSYPDGGPGAPGNRDKIMRPSAGSAVSRPGIAQNERL